MPPPPPLGDLIKISLSGTGTTRLWPQGPSSASPALLSTLPGNLSCSHDLLPALLQVIALRYWPPACTPQDTRVGRGGGMVCYQVNLGQCLRSWVRSISSSSKRQLPDCVPRPSGSKVKARSSDDPDLHNDVTPTPPPIYSATPLPPILLPPDPVCQPIQGPFSTKQT